MFGSKRKVTKEVVKYIKVAEWYIIGWIIVQAQIQTKMSMGGWWTSEIKLIRIEICAFSLKSVLAFFYAKQGWDPLHVPL